MASYIPEYDFSQSPTLYDFLFDRSRVTLVEGPVGSGKSTVCCVKPLVMTIMHQEVSPNDNIKYGRLIVVRNTYSELSTTTMKTWTGIHKEEYYGTITGNSPMFHTIKIPKINDPLRPGKDCGVNLEVIFLALDKPKDVKKLLSLESSVIWFNEFREIPKSILVHANGRIGRYPGMRDQGVNCTFRQIIGDTNAPDDDHWLHDLQYDLPPGWTFRRQPPGILEMEFRDGIYHTKEGEWRKYQTKNAKHIIQQNGTCWAVNTEAENIKYTDLDEHVNPDRDYRLAGSYYYENALGASKEYIQSMLQNKHVAVTEGKPVVPEFKPDLCVVDELKIIPDQPFYMGVDCGAGTLNPAAVFYQLHPIYQTKLIHFEVVAKDMGIENFSEQINLSCERYIPGHKVECGYGDPAGRNKDEIYETIVFDHITQFTGIRMREACATNKLEPRILAAKTPFNKTGPDGLPNIKIHRRCKTLIQALGGKWYYQKVQVLGEERYKTEPKKNHPYSDIGDAYGYGMIGSGVIKGITRGQERNKNYQVYINRGTSDHVSQRDPMRTRSYF